MSWMTKLKWSKHGSIHAFYSYTITSRVKLVRFSVVELIQLDSNLKFNMIVIFMANYSFSGR
jgi:hypothetical protein